MSATLPSKTILITRSQEDNFELESLLKAKGFFVECWHSFAFEKLPVTIDLNVAKKWDAIVFTSAASVDYFLELEKKPDHSQSFVACVGEKTAEYAKQKGIKVDLVPLQKTSKGLSQENFFQKQTRLEILLPQAEDAKNDFYEALKHQHNIQKLVLYRKQFTKLPIAIKDKSENLFYKWILFFSPSVVDAFFDVVNPKSLNNQFFAAIGPTTAAALKQYNLNCKVVAESSSQNLLDQII